MAMSMVIVMTVLGVVAMVFVVLVVRHEDLSFCVGMPRGGAGMTLLS
jgi:hypothetical protein